LKLPGLLHRHHFNFFFCSCLANVTLSIRHRMGVLMGFVDGVDGR